jgi:signal transduction histidine kinase
LALPVLERTVWPTYAEAGLPIATYMCALTFSSAAMIRGILTPTRQETDAVVELSDGAPGQALAEFRSLAEVEADPRRREALRSAIVLLEDNARLQRELAQRIDDVRASRARLIDAAVGERRRLERVLGEGALRYLSELEDCLATTPQDTKGDPTMALCLEELARTREDLEQLARGLHPRTLADRGLAAALEELSRRSPVHVESSAPAGRFPPRIETTIWYVCAEALTNVWKYSHATTAVVRVEESGGVLTASVQDDGCGGATLSPGGGLTGLVDRVSDVGGRLVLTSGAAGTDVTVTVPLR